MLEALAALGLGLLVVGVAVWLRRAELERQFGWLRARIEDPEYTYDVADVMEEANANV